jgi:hypothetical protein
MAHRVKESLDVEVNPTVYRKLYKQYVSRNTGKCERCRWHNGENSRKLSHTWKRFRNTRWKEG